jgi:thiol-disulfide isomerase/thioredoxin
MGIVVAALIVVGMVAALNLLLTFGVIRRLREHTELLSEGASGGGGFTTMLAAGETVGPFTATTADGRSVSREVIEGATLFAAFSVGCEACVEKLPTFVELAASHPGGAERVLVVVVGSDDEAAAPFVSELSLLAAVVREGNQGPVAAAFGVTGFPAFAVVDPGGVVRASAVNPARLPAGGHGAEHGVGHGGLELVPAANG